MNIAIVGVATRFPGDINTPGRDVDGAAGGARRDHRPAGGPLVGVPVRAADRRAGRQARARAAATCPTSRASTPSSSHCRRWRPTTSIRSSGWRLELTWEALEHARIPASSLRGRSVGVYMGSSNADYQNLALSDPTVAHPYAITGNSSSIIANRVSYFFDFRGPSMTIDTACSSSLVAAHEGIKALRAGDADVVIAGGVNALITPLVTVGFDEVGGVLAPDGRIKSFSQDADGYARSEGGGVLVLQAPRRRPPRRRRDLRGDRRRRRQPRRPVQRPARAQPRRAGSGAAQGVQGRRHRPAGPSTTSRRTAPAPSSATRSRPTRSAASSAGDAPTTSPHFSVR